MNVITKQSIIKKNSKKIDETGFNSPDLLTSFPSSDSIKNGNNLEDQYFSNPIKTKNDSKQEAVNKINSLFDNDSENKKNEIKLRNSEKLFPNDKKILDPKKCEPQKKIYINQLNTYEIPNSNADSDVMNENTKPVKNYTANLIYPSKAKSELGIIIIIS